MDSLTAEHDDYKMFWYGTLSLNERVSSLCRQVDRHGVHSRLIAECLVSTTYMRPISSPAAAAHFKANRRETKTGPN